LPPTLSESDQHLTAATANGFTRGREFYVVLLFCSMFSGDNVQQQMQQDPLDAVDVSWLALWWEESWEKKCAGEDGASASASAGGKGSEGMEHTHPPTPSASFGIFSPHLHCPLLHIPWCALPGIRALFESSSSHAFAGHGQAKQKQNYSTFPLNFAHLWASGIHKKEHIRLCGMEGIYKLIGILWKWPRPKNLLLFKHFA
jgi:hypothetical protein